LAKLAQAGNVPSFEEYMEVGKDEIGAFVIVAGSLMGMDNIDAVEAYDFLKSRSKFSQSSAEIVRYLNDLAGFEVRRHGYNILNQNIVRHCIIIPFHF